MRRLAAALLAAAACTAANATVTGGRLAVVAAGDTLTVTLLGLRVQNTPDSAVTLFSVRNAPTARVKISGPVNGVATTVGPVRLVPSPALAEGDTATVTACVTLYKRLLAVPLLPCARALYTRPVLPPTGTVDSLQLSALRVTPKTVALVGGSLQQFCAYSTTDGGTTWTGVSNQSAACGPTPASRPDPARDVRLRYEQMRLTLRPWFPHDSILPDPWEVYRAAQAG
jgi:hypothetical protein